MGFFDKLHEITKVVDPVSHYTVDLMHQSSTDIVNETSRAIEKTFGDTWLGNLGEHWKNMSQKDKDDFNRWATNTVASAAAIYGGMAAAGGSSAGAGAGGVAGGGAAGGGAGAAGAGAVGAGGGTVAGTTAGAGGWGSYAGMAASLGGSALQAYQSKKAADALLASGDAANATQRYIFDTLNAQQLPYRETGYNGLAGMNRLMSDPSSITTDPGYEFQRQQGMQGIERGAAARGLGLSGAALKAASRFNTDYATTKFNDVYNRYASAAGLGQVANGQSNQVGMNYGNNVSQTQMGMGNALAANYLNQGNIYGNALNQLGAYYSKQGG